MGKWISCNGKQLKKPEQVIGYTSLSESDKQVFTNFLKNFYQIYENPEAYIPTKVSLRKSKADGRYIKVDFEDNWYHVKSPTNWY